MLGDTADALICVQLWGRPEIVFMFPIFQFSRPFFLFFFFFIKVCRWKGWHRKLPWPGVRHSMSIIWRMDNPPELFLTPNKLPSAIIIIIISRQFNDDCSSYILPVWMYVAGSFSNSTYPPSIASFHHCHYHHHHHRCHWRDCNVGPLAFRRQWNLRAL